MLDFFTRLPAMVMQSNAFISITPWELESIEARFYAFLRRYVARRLLIYFTYYWSDKHIDHWFYWSVTEIILFVIIITRSYRLH